MEVTKDTVYDILVLMQTAAEKAAKGRSDSFAFTEEEKAEYGIRATKLRELAALLGDMAFAIW